MRTPALQIIWRRNCLLMKNGKEMQLGWDLTSPWQSAHNEKIINHLSSACISCSAVQIICSAAHTERACSAVYVNRACKLRGGQLKFPHETTTQPTEAAKSLYSQVSERCCLTFHPLSQLLHQKRKKKKPIFSGLITERHLDGSPGAAVRLDIKEQTGKICRLQRQRRRAAKSHPALNTALSEPLLV